MSQLVMIRAHFAVRKAFRTGDCSTGCFVGFFAPLAIALFMTGAT
jgi:hypothetical protein